MGEPQVIEIGVGDVALGARTWSGDGRRPVLLVHGLSSNARLWDEVAARLAGEGHPVVAVDLRGHGTSAGVPDPPGGPSATLTAAADLAAVCAGLGWAGSGDAGGGSAAALPDPGGVVVAGQSWGGNVVLQLAADRPDLVRGLALVDGGWLHLGASFADADAAWAELAPPRFAGTPASAVRERLWAAHPDWSAEAIDATMGNLAELTDGTVRPHLSRDRHRAVLASMVTHWPRTIYPQVRCRCLLLVAGLVRPDGVRRRGPDEALELLADADLVDFPGADHDLHAQHPDRVAALIGGLA